MTQVTNNYLRAKLQRMIDNWSNHHTDITSTTIERYSLSMQWLVWIGIFSICFFFAQLISSVIIISYYGSVDIKHIASQPDNLNALRYSQMLATIFSFFLPAIIFSRLKDKKFGRYEHVDKGFPFSYIVIISLMLVAIYPLIDFTFYINKWMPWSNWYASFQDDYKDIVKGLLQNDHIFIFVLNFITVALLPAICEEWIFRGTLQRLLSEKMNIHIAVFLASFFFSFIHFEFSGFLPRIVLGVFLGYLYYYSGSLWANIFAHAANNGAQVIFMYLNYKGIYKINIDQPELPKTWELIVYTAIFALLWYWFYRLTQKKKVVLL